MVTLGLASAMQEQIERLAAVLQPATPPLRLSHYTSFVGAKGIIQGRCIWSTRLCDQSDTEELNDAIKIIENIARTRKCSAYPSMMLSALPAALRERRKWLFITCFCEDHDSAYHWGTYGQYRFDIAVHDGQKILLRPIAQDVDRWLRQCIYSTEQFAEVAESAILSSIELIERFEGHLQGAWLPSIAESAAHSFAEIFLTIAVSLKSSQFAEDREYRLICSPRRNAASSAPRMSDEAFAPLIRVAQTKRGEVPYVPLYKGRGPGFPDESTFLSVTQSPLNMDDVEGAELNRDLDYLGESHCLRSS